MAQGATREQRTFAVILSEAKDLEFLDFRPFGREDQGRGLRVTGQATCSEQGAPFAQRPEGSDAMRFQTLRREKRRRGSA